MTDSMVTARMSSEKKRSGNIVLEQLGVNASQAINLLYDYVPDNRTLPFDTGYYRHEHRHRFLC